MADPASELARVLEVRDDAAALEERATRKCNTCGETAAEVGAMPVPVPVT